MLDKGVRLSSIASTLPISAIRVINERASKIPGVIHLEVGEPDLPTPKHVADAAERAIEDGFTHYTPSAGIIELREAISKKLARDNGLGYDAGTEIVVTNGANSALSLSLLAIIDPGSDIMIPDPGWANYEPLVKLVRANPIRYPLKEENCFTPKIDDIARLVTSRTRAIVINSPNNPTGGVMEKEDLELVAEFAKRKDIYVISDEVYEKILYDGAKHHSIASIDGMRDRTITVNAFSKTYCMTGWRLGYLAATKEIASAIVRLNSCANTCCSSISQAACLAALNGSQDCVDRMVDQFKKRRDSFVKGLNEIAGFSCVKPRGAFYAFASTKMINPSSFDLCLKILEEAKVATIPGVSFGPMGEGYLRFSYAASQAMLDTALERLASMFGRKN